MVHENSNILRHPGDHGDGGLVDCVTEDKMTEFQVYLKSIKGVTGQSYNWFYIVRSET